MCTLRRLAETLAIGVVALLGIAVPSAHATSLTFDFNSLASGANNASIQSYMQGVAGATGTVTVTGAIGQQTYNGDNHVVGPTSPLVSATLGTSNGGVYHSGYDTFITNVGGEASGNDRITMKFSFPIYSVSFDFEIFPDASCTALSNCGGTSHANLPDLEFSAGNSSAALVKQWFGAVPGSAGGSPFVHSPNSGLGNSEFAPQLLGQSGVFSFPGGVTELDFIDWPQKIGIDNLQVNSSIDSAPLTSVPEPSSLLLLSSGLGGLARAAWKKRSKSTRASHTAPDPSCRR